MWTEQDAANLRQFLASETGKRLVSEIRQTGPTISDASIETAALTAQKVSQREQDIATIKKLRDFRATENYRGPNWVRVTDLDSES